MAPPPPLQNPGENTAAEPLLLTSTPSQEKRRTRKALDLKKSSDLKCHHLQEQAAKLQGETTSLRSQLKEATGHIHELEMTEAQIREEFERERAELEREQGSSERESTGLRRLLESTQQQLKKEVELRHHVEHEAAKTKQGLGAIISNFIRGTSIMHAHWYMVQGVRIYLNFQRPGNEPSLSLSLSLSLPPPSLL